MTRSEAIEQAKHATLEQVRPYLPGKLRREGNSYRLVGHSGFLFFSKGQRWRWHWFSRDEGGDLLDFLTRCELGPRMSFQEAVEALTGRPWLSGGHRCPMEEKSDSPSLRPEPQAPRHDVALWTEKALAFCRWCHEQLMSSAGAKVRQWLREKRGLHGETLERFLLGWCPKTFFRQKSGWGVDDDGRLCLPSGLVIAKFDLQEKLVGITIRRIDESEAQRWGKYHSIPSPYGRGVWCIRQEPGPEDPRAGDWPLVIVEGELDGVLLGQECPDVNVAILGTAGRRPHNLQSHRDFWRVFSRAQKVFLCLDNDEAGRKAMSWWLKGWKHTMPLLPPRGKDVTESYLQAVGLKRWLLDAFDKAGLKGWPYFSLSVDVLGQEYRRE